MINVKQPLFETLKGFTTISLEQLNSTMSLLERMECKYVMSIAKFEKIIAKFQDKYFILNIKGNSLFGYESIYMDTADYGFYYQHEQGLNKRTKIRTRNYLDAKLMYFEYKQRDHELVRKFRYQGKVADHGVMTLESEKFYAGIHQSLHNEVPKELLYPTMITNYKRITLCSKKNDERVTIDFDIQLIDPKTKKSTSLTNVVILESKSRSKKCLSHQIMKQHEVKEAKGCSKYCLGMYFSKKAKTRNQFKPTINNIERIMRYATKNKLASTTIGIQSKENLSTIVTKEQFESKAPIIEKAPQTVRSSHLTTHSNEVKKPLITPKSTTKTPSKITKPSTSTIKKVLPIKKSIASSTTTTPSKVITKTPIKPTTKK